MAPLIEEALTHSVIGAFFEVYGALGFGFLEHIYALAMEIELRDRGHRVCRELGVSIQYKGIPLANQRLDMVVDERLVVDIKSTRDLPPIAKRQLHNYLRATNLEVGLLLHFGARPQFHRVVSTRAGAYAQTGRGRG
jgi:GxxExxY protein